MSGLRRDVDRLLRTLQRDEYGCTVTDTRNGHWKVHRPGYRSISISRTPSDWRAMKNIHSDIRRYLGIEL